VDENRKLVTAAPAVGQGGLRCSPCGKFVCGRCLRAFVAKAGPHIQDNWFCQVRSYLASGDDPEYYLVHSCEWKQQFKKMPPPSQEERKQLKTSPLKYDGFLHLYELCLLVDAPLNCVDVHGFSKCPPHFDAAYPRGGFEAHRFGGSSGRATLDAHFFRFIHQPSNLPRKGCGVKFVKMKDRWRCLYISTGPNHTKAKNGLVLSATGGWIV
jgi:hypothetical protein